MSGTLIVILNTLIMIGIVIAAIVAIQAKKVITSVIALDVTGSLAALEFLLLQAPDVAIAEASVGVVLTTVLYIVALRKVKEEDDA
jgi:energy-converting hydrogenase B subunit D